MNLVDNRKTCDFYFQYQKLEIFSFNMVLNVLILFVI